MTFINTSTYTPGLKITDNKKLWLGRLLLLPLKLVELI